MPHSTEAEVPSQWSTGTEYRLSPFFPDVGSAEPAREARAPRGMSRHRLLSEALDSVGATAISRRFQLTLAWLTAGACLAQCYPSWAFS
jgi:hypothetical protein